MLLNRPQTQTEFKCTDSYLSEVQGHVHLVELSVSGQRRALPPSLRPVDGVGDGMGTVAFSLAADVTVLALRMRIHRRAIRAAVADIIGLGLHFPNNHSHIIEN